MKILFVTLLLLSTVLMSSAINDKPSNQVNMFGFLKKGDTIAKFWTWFKANENRLRKFEENADKYLAEIIAQARKIQAGLAVELEPPRNNVINMTISADGDKNLFPVVQQIVSKAPKIDGWNIIAFRQRMNTDVVKGMKLKAQGHELDPGKMKFFPVIDNDTLDMIIYIDGVTEENYTQVAYGGLLLLDNILGEYDCVTKVRSYDFHNMPTRKEELNGLFPLLDLAAYVDKFHSERKK